jgi:hypothetical protein
LKRLYLETNFLMSVCTGRTPGAGELLNIEPTVELAIPIVSFMEAHKAFNDLKAAKLAFIEPFKQILFKGEIGDIGRDPDAPAQELVRALEAADEALSDVAPALLRYLDQSEKRLIEVIRATAHRARLLPSSGGVLARQVHSHRFDPTDDMILASIMDDASERPLEHMAFFSEDGGFGQPTVASAISDTGMSQFDSVDLCLDWCRS